MEDQVTSIFQCSSIFVASTCQYYFPQLLLVKWSHLRTDAHSSYTIIGNIVTVCIGFLFVHDLCILYITSPSYKDMNYARVSLRAITFFFTLSV